METNEALTLQGIAYLQTRGLMRLRSAPPPEPLRDAKTIQMSTK
jgi:hypothetical protein